MAWRCSQLLPVPVQLVLLASGIWGSTVIFEELHRMVGQSFSVQCQYKSEEEPYVLKTWCRQVSPNRCTRVVTTSEPRKAVRESQHTIWDDPEAGFFSITMTQLTENDSAFYWCGPFSPSRRKVTVLRNISLVVSPASSTLPSQMSTWLPESTVMTTSPEDITDSSINGSVHRNQSSSSPGWTSPGLLISVQYGLLLFKGLMLSVFCVLLCWRRGQGREHMAETEMMELSKLPHISKSLGTVSHISGCEKKANWF
ncbi:trem-like transcript 4 protein [Mastomys coucha]|uniref:trem-like transcript 4 protein n=1 Tax=Mastomys coucha TaxID=35658 RepID=UPI0012615942|nr:trem-like transcript 4 protein [Mastomys coucha]XP_031203321.1 trem-like transcript 4 protein [Mastomys coucha]